MGKFLPVRFKRVAEVFDDVATLGQLCESSGSEHSPESTMNLSDLVDSFIENDTRGDMNKREICNIGNENESDDHECERVSSYSDLKETLRDLFGCDENIEELKGNLILAIEEAVRFIRNVSAEGFKRQLMTRLRAKGFDAGLCKSKWNKNGHVPSGSYEYIDVYISGTRHIIEINLASQFEIARPTNTYSSLLQIFPSIFIGKFEDFKRIVRLTCTAIKHSMKRSEMALPPWRRYGYLQAKWFGSYKRTINESSVKNGFDYRDEDDVALKKSVGFVSLPMSSYYYRGNIETNIGFRMGQLAVEMNGNNMLL